MNSTPKFPPLPKARANLRSGAVYAIDGGDGFIYYGQIASNGMLGLFRIRSSELLPQQEVVTSDLMSQVSVMHHSIGQAIRGGFWKFLGLCSLNENLHTPPVQAQWPVGESKVTLWQNGKEIGIANVHDDQIQKIEVISTFDAIHHIPIRLVADFTGDQDLWMAGGPIWRHRVMKEKMAAKFPDAPWHALPKGWVPVDTAI